MSSGGRVSRPTCQVHDSSSGVVGTSTDFEKSAEGACITCRLQNDGDDLIGAEFALTGAGAVVTNNVLADVMGLPAARRQSFCPTGFHPS